MEVLASAMIKKMAAVDKIPPSLKMMLDETTIEQSLVNVEHTVAELKRQLVAPESAVIEN